MNEATAVPGGSESRSTAWAAHSAALWLPVAIGLALLYVPSYVGLFDNFRGTDLAAEEPIFLCACAWLVWRKRAALRAQPSARATACGWVLVAVAAPMYWIGRSQQFYQMEIGSQLPLTAGIVLVMAGGAALRELWFPLGLQVFLIPIPGSLLDSLLLPLKALVSSVVTDSLYQLGLPIGHDGVVISVGPYQLLIADACSGLNSMVALTAVGLVYVYLTSRRDWRLNALLLAAILPIAFMANVLRVAGLVLLTYYGGDASGRQFHGAAAYAEILIAFAAFLLIDSAVRRIDPALAAGSRGRTA